MYTAGHRSLLWCLLVLLLLHLLHHSPAAHPQPQFSFIASFASLNIQHIRSLCMYLIHIARSFASLHQFPQHQTHPFIRFVCSLVHSLSHAPLAKWCAIVFLSFCCFCSPALTHSFSICVCVCVHS